MEHLLCIRNENKATHTSYAKKEKKISMAYKIGQGHGVLYREMDI
jgi:hypothetical protein